jgi:cysteine desulfurase/selenocysteine lyase
VETIERLANWFFQAPPGVADGAPLDALNPLAGTLPPVIGIPGEAELRALLTHVNSLPQASSPPFYFLEYAPASPQTVSGIAPVAGREPFDLLEIRRDFPILQERVNGRPLVWLDNAATTQKPQSVIDRLKYFYEHEDSNIHRAAHELAARATDAYEQAREKVRGFLNASSVNEIVFVRGATEAINFVAQSWGRQNIGPDDEILLSVLEHHANIVPWQMLATEKGAKLKSDPRRRQWANPAGWLSKTAGS